MRATSLISRFAGVLAAVLLLLAAVPCSASGSGDEAEDLERRLDQLRSLPYTSQGNTEASLENTGVVINIPEEAAPGYNMYCCERCPDVFLMDMTGRIVHRWTYPDRRNAKWHHAIMLPAGDIVAVAKEPNGLVRLSWDSEVIWKKEIAAHHDVALAPDSTLYVIAGEKRAYRDLEVEFPLLLHLTLGGEVIDTWSAFEHLDEIRSAFDQRWFLDAILDSMISERKKDSLLEPISRRVHPTGQPEDDVVYDYFHMNTICLIPETRLAGSDPRFRPGNLLICFRNVNQIAILDRLTGEILWVWGEGILEWPHHPTMLTNGNVLVFDNGSRRKYSRVLEVNLLRGDIVWEYEGRPPASFYSFSRGSAQRLPNGNTLICEGDEGRVFEVNPEGEVVWKWLNSPTPEGFREQVYRMIRLPAAEVERLLKR